MPNKLLSIIMVNFKNEADLEDSIASVFKKASSWIDFEIILVNNDEKGKLEKISKIFPKVKIIESGKNLGFGAGSNLGVTSALGQIILFLNPDAQIISDNFSKIFSLFETDLNLGALGSNIISENGAVQPWSAGFETGIWDIFRNNLGIPKSRKIWQKSNFCYADWVSGTALFVRKDIFEKVGGFDEKFFMYFEDADFCKRIKNLGFSVAFYPGFRVMHLGGKSYENIKLQKEDYYRSQEYYFKKHKRKIEQTLYGFLKLFFK